MIEIHQKNLNEKKKKILELEKEIKSIECIIEKEKIKQISEDIEKIKKLYIGKYFLLQEIFSQSYAKIIDIKLDFDRKRPIILVYNKITITDFCFYSNINLVNNISFENIQDLQTNLIKEVQRKQIIEKIYKTLKKIEEDF